MSVDPQIGSRLKQRRSEVGVSLRKLAEMTGVTASFLSQVENGKANLSLNSLQRLSESLEVPILYFLSEDHQEEQKDSSSQEFQESKYVSTDSQEYSPLVRKDSGLKLVLPVSGVSYELLVPSLGRKMLAIGGRLAPETKNVARRLREPTEEFIHVISGVLVVELDLIEYRLEPGDSIYFEGKDLDKLTCGSEKEDVVWISVITPAIF